MEEALSDILGRAIAAKKEGNDDVAGAAAFEAACRIAELFERGVQALEDIAMNTRSD